MHRRVMTDIGGRLATLANEQLVNADDDRGDGSFAPPADALRDAFSALYAPTNERDAARPLPEMLPEDGIGEGATLARMVGPMLDNARRLDAPGFFAHMDPPTPWITWVTTAWAASTNQNLLHSDTAPQARDLERRVVSWIAPTFGMHAGQCVPGSTLANLTALWTARERGGVRDVVASEMAHLSVRKAAQILGLPYRTVPVDAGHRLRVDALGDVSRSALVLTAGTTTLGAVDPLGLRAAWVHVDAAWAGPLRWSETYCHLLDEIECADSIAISAHKWLFQPKESALVLFREIDALDSVTFEGAYLAAPNVGLLGSHGAAASTLLATLLAWGRRGIEKRIDQCMRTAERLADLVVASSDFELYAPPTTGVVLWRPIGEDAVRLRERLRNVYVSIAYVGQERWLRSVAANPMADPHAVFHAAEAALHRKD